MEACFHHGIKKDDFFLIIQTFFFAILFIWQYTISQLWNIKSELQDENAIAIKKCRIYRYKFATVRRKVWIVRYTVTLQLSGKQQQQKLRLSHYYLFLCFIPWQKKMLRKNQPELQDWTPKKNVWIVNQNLTILSLFYTIHSL